MARILVVDDDFSIGSMIKDILEYEDHEVILSQKPLQTKQNILEHDVDLVLLDKFIEGVDGSVICRELKNDKEVTGVPVVMMSALYNISEICKEAGAVDFILKPFDMETLLAKTREVITKHPKKS